jgi:hypothetical protein
MPANPRKPRERYELRRIADDATLNKAFRLAYSIYSYRKRDRVIALNVLSEALGAVEVRLMAQDEADRHDPQKPTKVRWSAAHWFQFLIYYKSEFYEKEQEADSSVKLTEADMVIRYIKHLVLITCRRNSFYVTLGLSRLLYDYSTPETMSIYDLVFQDPDSSTKKADAYYRDRKNRLIEQLQMRFHRFVKLYQGTRGENRFQTQEDSAQFADLTNEYLQSFTPWQTSCVLPEGLSEWSTIPDLQSNQVSQIHSVIHPPCFSRLAKALKLNPPESCLALPSFFLTSRSGERTPPSADSSSPMDLTSKEITAIRQTLSEDENRRKKFSPRFLSVMIDGVEHTRLDLTLIRQIHLEVDEDATLMQFVGSSPQGELILGTHVLGSEDDLAAGQSRTYSIVLEGGQKISLEIRHTLLADGTAASSVVDIKYSETNAARAIGLWWAQIRHQIFYSPDSKGKWNPALLPLRFALVLSTVVFVTLIVYFALKGRAPEPQQIAREERPPSTVEQPKPGSSTSPGVAPSDQPPIKPPGATGSPGSRFKPGGATRDQSSIPVKSLADVKRVYVESFGDDAFSRAVRQALIEKLGTASAFVVTEVPNDADTAIIGSAMQLAPVGNQAAGQITVELVNSAGDVIWPSRKYRGGVEQIAARFTRDLLEATRREEGKRKK